MLLITHRYREHCKVAIGPVLLGSRARFATARSATDEREQEPSQEPFRTPVDSGGLLTDVGNLNELAERLRQVCARPDHRPARADERSRLSGL